MSTTVCSQAQMVTYVLGSRLKAQELHSSLSAHKRLHPPVIHVVTLLVLPAPSLSQPTTTRSTTWTARSSPRTLCISSTNSTLRPSPRTRRSSSTSIPSANKVGKNRYKSSVTTKSRVAEPCEQSTPHFLCVCFANVLCALVFFVFVQLFYECRLRFVIGPLCFLR